MWILGRRRIAICSSAQLRWYDHYLKGEDNGIDREPPIEIFYMGVNKWQHAQDWPLPGTKFTPYYLGRRSATL